MVKYIENIDIKVSESYASAHTDVLHGLLGDDTSIDGFSPRQMECIWLAAAVYIYDIYSTRMHTGMV